MIGMNQSFNMEPPTATDVCDVKSKSVQRRIQRMVRNLCIVSAQRRPLELLVVVEEKCPNAQQDGYGTVW